MTEFYEAIIVGTGFGGAINACRLSKRYTCSAHIRERHMQWQRISKIPRLRNDVDRRQWQELNNADCLTSGTTRTSMWCLVPDSAVDRSSMPTCFLNHRMTCSPIVGPRAAEKRSCSRTIKCAKRC